MEYNDYFKHISIEEFKKLNVNDISYVQMNNGEIYVIDHPYTKELNVEENKPVKKQEYSQSSEAQYKNENQNKKKRKRKKKNKKLNEKEKEKVDDIISGENKKIDDNNNINNNLNENENYYDDYYNNNYDYDYNYNQEHVNLLDEQNNKSYKYNDDKLDPLTLPNDYFKRSNKIYRSNSFKIKNKRKILFNEEWKPINEYDIYERMKFYEEIPKRARFWETESYDATRSFFYSKRLQKNRKYQENQINFNNYTSIKQDSISSNSFEQNDNNYYQNIDTKSNPEENYENNNNYNNYDENSYNINENNYGYQDNLFSNVKDYYSLIFGPQFSQYLLGQNRAYNNNQAEGYGEENFNDNNDINYYQNNQYDYNNYNSQPYYQTEQNDYDYFDNNNFYGYNRIPGNEKRKKEKKRTKK